MKLDSIIQRRFVELKEKGESIPKAKILDFTSIEGKPYYKVPSSLYKEWATNVLNLLSRTFGENTPHYKHFAEHYSSFEGWVSNFEDSFAIFSTALEDYEGGYLFNIRTLAKAEVLADAMQQARELLAAGYKDPACILSRVALESALKDLAAKHQIPEATLDKMNADLCKAGAYNMAKQKLVTAWADIGNKAAHGDGSAYPNQDGTAMVSGVDALVATYKRGMMPSPSFWRTASATTELKRQPLRP